MADKSAKDKGKGKMIDKPPVIRPRPRSTSLQIREVETIKLSSSDDSEPEEFIPYAIPISARPSPPPVIRPQSTSLQIKEVETINLSSSYNSESEEFIPYAIPISARPSPANKEWQQEVEPLKDVELLSDFEALDSLNSLKDPMWKIPKSFDSVLEFLKDAVQYTDLINARRALENLKDHGASDWEITMLANTCPNTLEEAYALIPSLKDKRDSIENILSIALGTLGIFKFTNWDRRR